MGKPISIDFAADTRQVIRETDNLAEAFGDVATSLDDLGRDSAKSGEKVEDSVKDAAKSVDKLEDALDDGGDAAKKMDKTVSRAFESMEDEAKLAAKGTRSAAQDAFQDIERDAKDTGRAVERGLGDGFDGASEGVQELGEEAAGEAREMASSFDGSIESVAEMFQSLAANAFAGFGPAGAAAGLAAAVGLGMAISKLQESAEVNTEAKTSMAELGREIYATGGQLDAADIAGKIADIGFSLATEDSWMKWGDQAETYVGLVKSSMEGLDKVDIQDAFKGLAGDVDAAGRAQAKLASEIEAGNEALEDHQTITATGLIIYDEEGAAIQARQGKLEELSKKIEENSGVQSDATSEVEFYTDVMGESAEVIQSAADAAQEAKDAVDALAASQTEAADANMGADAAALDYNETLRQLTEDIASNGQSWDINTEAGRANRQSMLDLADSSNSVIESLVNQGGTTADVTARAQELRQAFVDQAMAAGLGGDAAEALATSYGLIPGNVETLVQAHGTEEAKAAVESIPESKDTDVNVTENGTAGVQDGLDAIKPPEPEVKVTEDGTAAVQQAIDNIKGRDVSITVSIANWAAINQSLNNLTAPRTAYVDVIQRPGVSAP